MKIEKIIHRIVVFVIFFLLIFSFSDRQHVFGTELYEEQYSENKSIKETGIIEIYSGTINVVIPQFSWQFFQIQDDTQAPWDAVTTLVEYRLNIDECPPPHDVGEFRCDTYEIYLCTNSVGPTLLVYDNLGGTTDQNWDDDVPDDTDIFLNWRGTHALDGGLANQIWCVWFYTLPCGSFPYYCWGCLEYLDLRIHWEVPEADPLIFADGFESSDTYGWSFEAPLMPGRVRSHRKISSTSGGFTGVLDDGDYFGRSLASLGDLDGDGFTELAVGAPSDDDGGTNHGAVWVLSLNANGTVRSHQKISDTQGGLTGVLDEYDNFGRSVASLGDLDGDGVTDLAVGALLDDDGGTDHGAVWVLFLNPDGTVRTHQKISSTSGGFTGNLDDGDSLGSGVASLGDFDGDGVADLAVGALQDDDGGTDRGAVWVLFLNSDGTVSTHQKISDAVGGFTGRLDNDDKLGRDLASLGDLDGDGVTDLAVGAVLDDDGGLDRGAVWSLFLDASGSVDRRAKISNSSGRFVGVLDDQDLFGNSLASVGDLDGDGNVDIAVGALKDDDGGADRGAVWLLFLSGN